MCVIEHFNVDFPITVTICSVKLVCWTQNTFIALTIQPEYAYNLNEPAMKGKNNNNDRELPCSFTALTNKQRKLQ